MPTKLFFKEEYLTPDELLELLANHFEQMPTELIFRPQLNFISCDKNRNETVIYHKSDRKIAGGMCLGKTGKPYSKDFCMKTIKRDKTKAN